MLLKFLEKLENPVLWGPLAAIAVGLIGVSGVVVGVWSSRSISRKERKRDRLQSQLTLLYGPIYYSVLQNKKLFELNKRFLEVYDREESRAESAKTTLGLANEYIHEVIKNNERIKKILDDHFAWCSPRDIESMVLFYEHYVRHKTEIDESGKLKTPMRVYKHIGSISFMRPEFMQEIEKRCQAKQREYLQITS